MTILSKVNIKFIYKIINSEMDSRNAIGKHWLQKYDKKFGVDFFLCKCSDIKGLDDASIPNTIKTLYKHGTIFLGHVLRSLKMTF